MERCRPTTFKQALPRDGRLRPRGPESAGFPGTTHGWHFNLREDLCHASSQHNQVALCLHSDGVRRFLVVKHFAARIRSTAVAESDEVVEGTDRVSMHNVV